MSTRRRLSQLLVTSHMGLVLGFAALLLATGAGTIRSAVVGQARTEAERAVSEVRIRLQQAQRELAVAADLLAEQPTLRFYLERDQRTKARQLIADFHATSNVDYLQVRWHGEALAEFGTPPPATASGLAFAADGRAWRVVERGIPELGEARLVLAVAIDPALLRPTGGDTAQVRLQALPVAAADPADPWTPVLASVAESGEARTVEGIGDAAAARIVALRGNDGAPAGLLAATVSREWVRRRSLEWIAASGASMLLTAAIALALAVVLARRIARPFAQLSAEAERLGRGNLATPVRHPVSFLAEPLALATSLEEMREQVARLTATERRQREELDAVLDGVDEGIVGVDAGRRIHYANRQFLELVGMSRERVLGSPLEECLLPVPAGDPVQATDGGLPPLQRHTTADGMRALTVRRRSASGEREVLVVREENAIEAARAMRDRVLANLSHEFQTPLSAQLASIELLCDHLAGGGDAVALRLANAQLRGTMRLAQLVDNLLDSVRIESGEMRLRRQPVDLAAVVEEALELMQPLIDQRDQRIVADLRPGPLFTGDPQRLASVLVNLLANANKFAPDQTAIRVSLEWTAPRVTLWVEDEGPGLPSAHPVRDLFAPFRRAPHEEPSQRGSGLGLAIVHALVAAHGGQVHVGPGTHGRGARIGVSLPLEAPR